MTTSDELVARVAIAQVCEPAEHHVAVLIEQVGVVGAVDALRSSPNRLRKPDLGAAAKEIERCLSIGVRLVAPDSRDWPTQLDALGSRRPLLLWVAGNADLRLGALRSVAVVGARAASAYGVRVAADFGAELAQAGWTVVSGGAYGIDAAAHRGAMAGQGTTIAVLACGVDVPYPRGNESLFARILPEGLLVSEVPLGNAPRRLRFLVRNRVIAALTRGTVVVEAATRSGALGTAAEAERLNRFVMAVPGPIDSFVSAGTNRAIREGATLVGSAAEVIELVGDLGDDLAPTPRRPKRPRDRLSPLARQLVELFPAHAPARGIDLAGLAGLTPAVIPVLLAELLEAALIRPAGQDWELTPLACA